MHWQPHDCFITSSQRLDFKLPHLVSLVLGLWSWFEDVQTFLIEVKQFSFFKLNHLEQEYMIWSEGNNDLYTGTLKK